MAYRVVPHLTEHQISELLDLYKQEFWSQKRERDDVVKMLAATDIAIALVDDSDQLIGFTRVLTDFVYRAIIYDVIIKSNYRKMGLGSQLLNAVVNHPKLASVEQIALYCLPEIIPFYEKWGFTANTGGIQLMYRTSNQ
ncbi:GCN5 family acetyltransferase [Scytonema hofmannii PCC 7110]|uniref:GCN5 family acetyltransferase n=1 Tax=Scytonema hofmannii PCC 7110 TaxID=128403 RepID=A0A139XD06_9CYAN|nr:GNAT family N-acetyltransferase [Scytonema hofmannii]KYC42565.1 GCN5 family acetyltransferase [Scytonema hofmannii PCC 7110]